MSSDRRLAVARSVSATLMTSQNSAGVSRFRPRLKRQFKRTGKSAHPIPILVAAFVSRFEGTLAMPTILIEGCYRFFFDSADRDEPPHVHVERDQCSAAFWLEPVRKDAVGSRGRN